MNKIKILFKAKIVYSVFIKDLSLGNNFINEKWQADTMHKTQKGRELKLERGIHL